MILNTDCTKKRCMWVPKNVNYSSNVHTIVKCWLIIKLWISCAVIQAVRHPGMKEALGCLFFFFWGEGFRNSVIVAGKIWLQEATPTDNCQAGWRPDPSPSLTQSPGGRVSISVTVWQLQIRSLYPQSVKCIQVLNLHCSHLSTPVRLILLVLFR